MARTSLTTAVSGDDGDDAARPLPHRLQGDQREADGNEGFEQVTVRQPTGIGGALEAVKRREIPQWLELDSAAMKSKVRDLPSRDDITAPMEERLVVELYSK